MDRLLALKKYKPDSFMLPIIKKNTLNTQILMKYGTLCVYCNVQLPASSEIADQRQKKIKAQSMPKLV